MSTNTFGKVLSYDALVKSWQDISTNSSGPSRNTQGGDEVSINDFAVNWKTNIRQLSRDLKVGKFQFRPLKPYLIPKANGKVRLICVPTVNDRIVQRALSLYISTKYRTQIANNVSYGFVKHRSVKQAAQTACAMRKANPWVFKTDITSFFDNIKRDMMISGLKKIVKERSLYNVLAEAVWCEVQATKNSTEKQIESLGIQRGLGVRQGMPLSPLFSNILLIPFDELIQKRGFKAVRYADDLIFFAKSKEECESIFTFCQSELAKFELKIPAIGPGSKSVIYAPNESSEFLGLELAVAKHSYELRLSETQKLHIRDELLKFGSIPELLARKITLKNLAAILSNKKNGYLAAYDVCENLPGLEAILGDVEQKVLTRIYTQGLGIEIPKLNREARTFLGLN